MSLNSKESKNNNEIKKDELICPNAPIITKKPLMKKIPYINVIEDDDDSSNSEDQNEKPKSKAFEYNKKDMDDRYDDEDSFDDGFIAEQETKSESGNNNKCFKKFKEDNAETVF